MKIEAIAKQIKSGTKTYPIYIAFMSATDIKEYAMVPAFGSLTSNDQIATNVLTPPIREWQRPLDQERVDKIAVVFDDSGELMPNPVLLAENVTGNSPTITTAAKMVGGLQSGLVEIELSTPSQGQAKPLWILDGQHRINGLAASEQKDNVVPVVFLLNHGGSFYDGPILAKLFAQVTTTSQKLDELHNEWLTFAFNLERYSIVAPARIQNKHSMEVVACLCKTSNIAGITNPFFNRIKFNSQVPINPPAPGGFSYTCIELQRLIFERYYNMPMQSHQHLVPIKLAEQIILAHAALVSCVQNPQQSVFFGTTGEAQRIMQDAFFAGIFAYIIKNGIPTSWVHELQNLQFDSTNWRFNWVTSLNGASASISRSLAFAVMSECFENKNLCGSTSGNMVDILKGNDSKVLAIFSRLNDKQKVIPTGRSQLTLARGQALSHAISPCHHIRFKALTSNIGKLIVTDKNSPPGRLITYSEATFGGQGEKMYLIQLTFTLNDVNSRFSRRCAFLCFVAFTHKL